MAPDKPPAVDPKMLSSVTQMLTTPDADRVMQGIELVRSLDDEALCDALLEGVVYEYGRLVPNEAHGPAPLSPPWPRLSAKSASQHPN